MKPETEIRNLRRENAQLRRDRDEMKTLAARLGRDLTAVTADRDEWKRRFDILLARTPEVPR
jgi:FtsZ-binding cell division protein ZapB